jgi:hypothetical protein
VKGRATQIFNTARNAVEHFIPSPVLWAFLSVACVAFGFLAVHFADGVVSGFRSAITTREVQATEGQAAQASADAGAQLGAANETGIERRVNDRVREQTITPELEHTARASEHARERTTRARANYETAQTNSFRGGGTDSDLHKRNCADLAGLYPGARFARCSQ